MTITPAQVTFDTTDALGLAGWWSDQLGGSFADDSDGWYVVVTAPNGWSLAFQKVDDPTPGKNRAHLDFVTDDVPGEVAKLVANGATVVAEREIPGFGWTTLADPAGNQFCVSPMPH